MQPKSFRAGSFLVGTILFTVVVAGFNSALLVTHASTPIVPNVSVMPSQGISFSELNFTYEVAGYTYENLTLSGPDTGQVDVTIATLQSATGISSGYVNVETSLGWVVQNLPIESGFPFLNVSTTFQLDNTTGSQVLSLSAFVDYSAAPALNFTGGPFVQFPVASLQFGAAGFGAGPVGKPAPPPFNGVQFVPGGPIALGCNQAGHKNIAAANNQCAPAAAANSLDYLRTKYQLNIAEPNNPGLGCKLPQKSDGTLVGAMDFYMKRVCTNNAIGMATPYINILLGQLCYLGDAGLGPKVVIQHTVSKQSIKDTPPFTIPIPQSGTVSYCGVNSLGQGDVTPAQMAAYLIAAVCNGEAVELGYSFTANVPIINPLTGGYVIDAAGKVMTQTIKAGHMVQVVGAGTTLGIPWIAYQSDHNQNGKGGTGFTDISNLIDSDKDGRLNLAGGGAPKDANIDFVMTISVLPPAGAASRDGGGRIAEESLVGFAGFAILAILLIAAKPTLRSNPIITAGRKIPHNRNRARARSEHPDFVPLYGGLGYLVRKKYVL